MNIKEIFKKALDPITLGFFQIPLSNALFTYLDNQKRRLDRRKLEHKLLGKRLMKNTVQFGPFEGMEYPEKWASCKFQKIIGCYEAELHPILKDIKAKQASYTSMINIGSAEGYFAVGLGRQITEIPIYCYESQKNCQTSLRDLACINGVFERISIDGECTAENLKHIDAGKYPLVICDVEGAELNLLVQDQVPWLKHADILVELHDYFIPGISKNIHDRFRKSHQIETITSQGLTYKNYPILKHLSFREILLMTDEDRPKLQNWYFMTPKKV